MRHCPVCQRPFTPGRHNPRQRYCCATCRKLAWRHRKSDRPTDRRGGDGSRGGAVAGVTARCPHCAQTVTVVALLVPPGAATVHLDTRHGRD